MYMERFDFKQYYKDNRDKFRTDANIKYYKKITNTSKAELDTYTKMGLTPEKILNKLKEKSLISKIQKLHAKV